MVKNMVAALSLALLLTACQIVPGTGDTAKDPAAAQQFLPNIAGYVATEANSITDALGKAGVSASMITGNVALAGVIAKLDDMMRCYQGVGAIAARVYLEPNINLNSVPKVGAVAVINTTRVQRNLLNCVLNTGASAQSLGQIEPCGGSGSFTVNGENLQYLYGATDPALCSAIQASFPRQ